MGKITVGSLTFQLAHYRNPSPYQRLKVKGPGALVCEGLPTPISNYWEISESVVKTATLLEENGKLREA